MDYLDGGDYFRRRFPSTSDVSSCVCSGLMFLNLQHVSGLCSMSPLDGVFRSLLAVVLIFFVLMDPSLLVFDTGALHRKYEPIITD
jgi:hypothetical protein